MKKLFILLPIGLLIFLIMKFPYSTINPGELAEAHQKLKNECFSCHEPFGGIANDKCISCHTLSDIGKDTLGNHSTALFHENLADQECSSCHGEHEGLFPKPVSGGFKHELLSGSIINDCISCHNKPVDNLHTQVKDNCNSCHQNQSWKGTTSFSHEALLNKSNCISCHERPTDEFHRLTAESCEKCHSTNKWVPSTFDHSVYFILDQDHNATCNTCHINNNYSQVT